MGPRQDEARFLGDSSKGFSEASHVKADVPADQTNVRYRVP